MVRKHIHAAFLYSPKLIPASDGDLVEATRNTWELRHSVKLISASDGHGVWGCVLLIANRHSVKLISASDGQSIPEKAEQSRRPPFGEVDFSE